MKHVDVAIAILQRSDGHILISRRHNDNPTFAGLWEFPGGKAEPGESPPDALRRELREELGIDLTIDRPLAMIEHTYPTFKATLHPYLCRIASGTPSPLASQELRWIPLADLRHYPFPEGNTPLLARLPELLQDPNAARLPS